MTLETGDPDFDGQYATVQAFGWLVLEWWEGRWYVPGRVTLWPGRPVTQWVGPLPSLPKRERILVPPRPVKFINEGPIAMEFDL